MIAIDGLADAIYLQDIDNGNYISSVPSSSADIVMPLPGEQVGSPHSLPRQRGAGEQGTRDMFMGLGNDGG